MIIYDSSQMHENSIESFTDNNYQFLVGLHWLILKLSVPYDRFLNCLAIDKQISFSILRIQNLRGNILIILAFRKLCFLYVYYVM